MVRIPGQARGLDYDGLVSLVDIAATAYGYARVPPPPGLRGRDLLREGPRTDGEGWVYVQGWDNAQHDWARAVIFGDGYRWVVDPPGAEELYARGGAGLETRVTEPADGVERRMRKRFERVGASMRSPDDTPVDIESLPDEVSDQLRALGYVQ